MQLKRPPERRLQTQRIPTYVTRRLCVFPLIVCSCSFWQTYIRGSQVAAPRPPSFNSLRYVSDFTEHR